MKEQITREFVDLTIRVPAPLAVRMQRFMEAALELIEDQEHDRLYAFEELFPDFHAGNALRGARTREGLTQAQLAERVGVKIHHISEMELRFDCQTEPCPVPPNHRLFGYPALTL